MKKLMTLVLALCVIAFASAEKLTVSSPDNQLQVQISQDAQGAVFYQVTYQGKVMLEDSPLGMITNVNDFGKRLKLIDSQTDVVKNLIPKVRLSTVRWTILRISWSVILWYGTIKGLV